MSEKQVKVAKPTPAKPNPVKPTPVKPGTVKPAKAEAHGNTCIRCCKAPSTVRNVCSACDKTLQDMHWNQEYSLFGKIIYMFADDKPSPQWLRDNGFADYLRKPSRQRTVADATPVATEVALL